MIGRGYENETLLKQRLRRFDFELSYKTKFNYIFVNENLDKTAIEIEKLIKENV